MASAPKRSDAVDPLPSNLRPVPTGFVALNGTNTLQTGSMASNHATEPSSPAPNLRLRRGKTIWWIAQDWEDRLLGREAPDWLALEKETRAECVKKGHRRATWKVHLGKCAVFAKVHDTGSIWDRVRHRLGGNPAWREWRAASEAFRRGVSIPKIMEGTRILRIESLRPYFMRAEALVFAEQEMSENRS